MIGDSFFRSMSLAEDLGQPSRFAHYKPTRRALPVLAAILRPGASTMVIAPYGSGKSLAAGVASLAVRNEAADGGIVAPLTGAIGNIDPAAGEAIAARLVSDKRGLVIALTGYEPQPLAAIAAAIGMKKAPQSVEGFRKALAEGSWDHVAIVWDEFGRHLEGIVGSGRPDELDVLQRLAERSARASEPTMSLTLLLHQNLLSYASRLNETTRSEWRKVEGRFSIVRMIEDSQEIYQLIAQVVGELRPQAVWDPVGPDVAMRVRAARWLDDMPDSTLIAKTLADARPLTAGALQTLPVLAARVGQHERSLFTFLRATDLSSTIGLEEVYAAFSDALRSDVGIGGAYRRWLETESARSRASNALQREILAAACLLQLGASGERKRLPRDVLELAVLRPSTSPKEIASAVDTLIDANLLLWRRHNDDVAVWHGADIDVSIRVREERERHALGFDLKSFLEERFPAPSLRVPGHNARHGVNRFFTGAYVTAAEAGQARVKNGQSRIEYVLAANQVEIAAAQNAAGDEQAPGTIIVVPDRPIDVESAAIEILALEALRKDEEFVASDPMVVTELDELESVAFEQLATLLRSVLDPSTSASTWWSEGKRLDISADRPGSVAASLLLDRWYDLTPRIANEQLMRDAASRTMQTARVRVVGAILEHHCREHLGYAPDDRGAEGSIYRTVLERTGLHRPGAGGWTFAHIDDLEGGIAKVWTNIALFFRTPTDARGKPLSQLVELLRGAPYGVPAAVLPLLLAAGYKAFARTVALYVDGVYVPDILGFQFDQLVMRPENVSVRVETADIVKINYLRETAYAFTHEYPAADDELVRAAYDAVAGWRAGVSEGSRRTQKLDIQAKKLLRAIDDARDPMDMLLKAIPAAFGAGAPDVSLIPAVERSRSQIDGLTEAFAAEAIDVLTHAFRGASTSADLIPAVKRWAACFNIAEMESRGDLRISDKAVLRKAVETVNGRFSPKSFASAISSILLQRSLEKWDDRTAVDFQAALREARERLEAAALDTRQPTASLRPLIVSRLDELGGLLARIDARPEHPGSLKKGGGRQ